jgi:hypothetical protein
MSFIINIGLNREGRPALEVTEAFKVLGRAGFWVGQHALHHSDTELTLVASVNTDRAAAPAIHEVAVALGQDCIACYDPSYRHGRLIGPRAAAWGEFNPEFFLQLDGTRLAPSTAARAA